MRVRYKELDGMLPAVIEVAQKLLDKYPDAKVVRGYDCRAGADSLFAWGAACQISIPDKTALQVDASKDGADVDKKGILTYVAGRTIEDFKTFRVNGRLEMRDPEDLEVSVSQVEKEVN